MRIAPKGKVISSFVGKLISRLKIKKRLVRFLKKVLRGVFEFTANNVALNILLNL